MKMNIDEYKQKMNIDDNDLGWLWLDKFEFLNVNKKVKIREVVGKGSELFKLEKYSKQIIEICGEDNFRKMQLDSNNFSLQLCFNEVVGYVDFISIDNEAYPESLRNIAVPPVVLYYKGDISLLKNRILALCGTRLFSPYGHQVTNSFVNSFINAGLTLMSGLNEGLDSVVHKIALEKGAKSIAVLSGGYNKIYPVHNTHLCKQIAKSGLVISEWRPNKESYGFMFPIRGRIMMGLAEGLLVTEAGVKSGTRFLVDYAIESNKTVYAVPGNITSYKSSFTNSLIKSCQSMMVTHPDDILNDMNVVYEAIKIKEDVSIDEAKIFAILDNIDTAHFDFIVVKTGLEPRRLLGLLTGLEIKGKVKKIPGNRFMKIV